MAINKKLFLGLLILLLVIMAGVIIKSFSGSSDEPAGQTSQPTLAASTNTGADNHPSLSEQARDNRQRRLDGMRDESMQTPLLTDPTRRPANETPATARPAASGQAAGKPQANKTQTPIVLVPEANQTPNATAFVPQQDNRTTAAQPQTATAESSVRAQTNKTQLTSQTAARPAQKTTAKGTFKVRVRPSGHSVIIEISASGPIDTYKSHVLQSPQRVMLDIDGQWTMSGIPTVPSQTVVEKVRFGRHPDSGRLVADIKTQRQVTVTVDQPSPDRLNLTITPK